MTYFRYSDEIHNKGMSGNGYRGDGDTLEPIFRKIGQKSSG